MRPCFAFSAKTATKPAVLALDEEIGFWGTQAKDFRNQLDLVDGDLDIEINSVGGDVMAGLGMYNMLRNHAAKGHTVTTRVTGVAASIASIIALAGDKREMPSNAFAMVHAVSGGAWGTADEIREQADVVDKIQASLRKIYVDRMGIDDNKAVEIMAKDTWLNADEALAMGFVTSVVDPVHATAKFDLQRAALPEHVAAVFKNQAEDPAPEPVQEPEPEPVQEPVLEVPDTPVAMEIVAAAEGLGLADHAPTFALQFASVDEARARMKEAREINALCNIVKRPHAAKSLIRSGKTVAEARIELVNLLASEDEHIDNAPKNEHPTPARSSAKPTVVDANAIWASHNSQKKEGR